MKDVVVATHPIETKKSLAYIPEQVALYCTADEPEYDLLKSRKWTGGS